MRMDTMMRSPGRYNSRRNTIPPDFDLELSFDVHHGEGIDPPSRSISDRTYFLVWWLIPGEDNWAPFPAEGKPFDPRWNIIWNDQRFDKHVYPGFIYVEVMRRRDKCEVGTSGGIATVVKNGKERVVEPGTTPGATVYGIESVSRCKIPLPSPGEKSSGSYRLVKVDGYGLIEQGHIFVTVEQNKVFK